jgi:aspartate racemase
MKTIGIIGGMSWESTLEYYRTINRLVQARLGGLSSASCIVDSLDFAPVSLLMRSGKWEDIAAILTRKAVGLQQAGAQLILIATNTMHIVYEQIAGAVDVPMIHIADATGTAIAARGLTRVGLLGTRFTMEMDFYTSRLRSRFNLGVVVPPPDSREEIDRIIFEELCMGLFLPESTGRIRAIISRLVGGGAQGIALACTELPLVVKQQDVEVPIFDTMRLHCEAAVRISLEDSNSSDRQK